VIAWSILRVGSSTFAAAYHVSAGAGGLAVAGARNSATGALEGWVTQLTPAGDERWLRNYQAGAVLDPELAYGVVLEDSGRVVATGVQDQGGASALWARGWDIAGATLWTATYLGDGSVNGQQGFDVARVPTGGYVISAITRRMAADAATLMFVNDAGTITGQFDFALDTPTGNLARCVRVVDDGFVYAGWGTGVNTGQDGYARRVKSLQALWTYRDPAVAGADLAHGLDLAGSDVVVSGWDASTGFIARLDQNGQLRWRRPLTGTAAVQAAQVACHTDGSCVVLYMEIGTITTHRAYLRKYDAAGQPLWTRRILGRTGAVNGMYAHGVDFAPDGALYVAGQEALTATTTVAFIRRYAP